MTEHHWEQRPDGTPVRVLRDGATGRKWRVWVADTSSVPGARAACCLLFDTGDLVRRVWHVPDDWSRMAPEALIRLAEASPRERHERHERHERPDRAGYRIGYVARADGWG